MENRDLFTMRELGDRDLEQFNSLLKYAFQVTSDEMLKTGWQEDEMKYSKAPMLKNAFVLGWFHGENLASQIVISPMAVSYTHLDVYKRQVTQNTGSPASSPMTTSSTVPSLRTTVPVSYTHLQ